MKTIFIEKIMQEKDGELVLVGIGSIWDSRKKAVDFLRRVKGDLGNSLINYSEKELSISYKLFSKVVLKFEERFVG